MMYDDEPNELPTLTAAELIALLATVPSDAIVMIAGCDCWGAAAGIQVLPPDDTDPDTGVLICRSDRAQCASGPLILPARPDGAPE
jgi:hypothetical protein